MLSSVQKRYMVYLLSLASMVVGFSLISLSLSDRMSQATKQEEQKKMDFQEKRAAFPWFGLLTKASHRDRNPEMWSTINSSSDYAMIKSHVTADMRALMEQEGFFEQMVQHVLSGYKSMPGLDEDLIVHAEVLKLALLNGGVPDLYSLAQNSVTNVATHFYQEKEAADPLNDIIATTEFFLSHVRAEVTRRYLERVGYRLPPVTLDRVNLNEAPNIRIRPIKAPFSV